MKKLIAVLAFILVPMGSYAKNFDIFTCDIAVMKIAENGEAISPFQMFPTKSLGALIIDDGYKFEVRFLSSGKLYSQTSPVLEKTPAGNYWGEKPVNNGKMLFAKDSSGYAISKNNEEWITFKNCVDGDVRRW